MESNSLQDLIHSLPILHYKYNLSCRKHSCLCFSSFILCSSLRGEERGWRQLAACTINWGASVHLNNKRSWIGKMRQYREEAICCYGGKERRWCTMCFDLWCNSSIVLNTLSFLFIIYTYLGYRRLGCLVFVEAGFVVWEVIIQRYGHFGALVYVGVLVYDMMLKGCTKYEHLNT